MKTVECKQWSPAGEGFGACSLGIAGGKPGYDFCERVCLPIRNKTPSDPSVAEHISKQLAGCRGCGDEPPEM